jgi:hypothetical protein
MREREIFFVSVFLVSGSALAAQTPQNPLCNVIQRVPRARCSPRAWTTTQTGAPSPCWKAHENTRTDTLTTRTHTHNTVSVLSLSLSLVLCVYVFVCAKTNAVENLSYVK